MVIVIYNLQIAGLGHFLQIVFFSNWFAKFAIFCPDYLFLNLQICDFLQIAFLCQFLQNANRRLDHFLAYPVDL